MRLHIHPITPQQRLIEQAVAVLQRGGIIIYPTDTLYGLGCDIFQKDAVERICALKGLDPKKAMLSFVCNDLSHLSEYARQLSTPVYRAIKNRLPGPFTFILEGGKTVPRLLKSKRDTVGIRVPDHPIPQALVRALGRPILSTSLPVADLSAYTDPDDIEDAFGDRVDLLIDGGPGGAQPSTVVDFTADEPVVVRQGAGVWN